MKKIILLLMVLIVVSSCEGYLTIEPENSIQTVDAITSGEDIQRTLVSGYDVMRNGSYLGGGMWTMGELAADNAEKDFSDFGWDQIAQRSMNLFNPEGRSCWQNGYYSIKRANYVLYLLENTNFEDLSVQDRERMEGESYFMRAIAHFELLRFYALPYDETKVNDQPGIPLRLSSINDIETTAEPVPRASVQAVYDTVITDLKKAEIMLPEENGGYATSWAAKAYLARIYFQMNDFDHAYAYADEVIEMGGFDLNMNVQDRFSVRNSVEAIFELQSTAAGNNSASSLIGNYRQDKSNPGFHPSMDIVNQATSDENDMRGQLFYNTRAISVGGTVERTYTSKFDYDFMNVPVLHLAEMYLIRAEAAIDKTIQDLPQAIADLQEIRDRAYGEGNKDISSAIVEDDLRAMCRFERRLELAFEGNRFHDLKRTKSDVRGLPYNSDELVWQIPDIEQAGNPDMVMNP